VKKEKQEQLAHRFFAKTFLPQKLFPSSLKRAKGQSTTVFYKKQNFIFSRLAIVVVKKKFARKTKFFPCPSLSDFSRQCKQQGFLFVGNWIFLFFFLSFFSSLKHPVQGDETPIV